jgi:hypothetical protein
MPAPYHLNSDSLPSAFRQDDVAFRRGCGLGRLRGEITMTEVLNEVDRGEPDQFAPTSDIVLGGSVSQEIICGTNTPVAKRGAESAAASAALEDRDRRYELQMQQSLTAAFFGDPPPGRSALDRRRAEQERLARQSEAQASGDFL